MAFADPPVDLQQRAVLNLARDPFSPEMSQAVPPERFHYASSGALDPVVHVDHLTCYLNLYDWKDAGKVGGLRPDGRLASLRRANQDGAMVLLVSGFRGCGRSSAVNLLLYEIGQQIGQPPLVIPYSTQITEKRVQHSLDIAASLAKAVGRHQSGGTVLADTLKGVIKDWRENVISPDDANPETLFQDLKNEIGRDFPIVVVLDAKDHKIMNDIWRPICSLLKTLAQFIIIVLSNKEEAKLFRTSLSLGQFEVGWIDAPRLPKAKMVELLTDRLARERARVDLATAPLSPFTSGAIDMLYRPASGASSPRECSIQEALSDLAGVFGEKIKQLEQMIGEGTQPTDADILISAQDMERYLRARQIPGRVP